MVAPSSSPTIDYLELYKLPKGSEHTNPCHTVVRVVTTFFSTLCGPISSTASALYNHVRKKGVKKIATDGLSVTAANLKNKPKETIKKTAQLALNQLFPLSYASLSLLSQTQIGFRKHKVTTVALIAVSCFAIYTEAAPSFVGSSPEKDTHTITKIARCLLHEERGIKDCSPTSATGFSVYAKNSDSQGMIFTSVEEGALCHLIASKKEVPLQICRNEQFEITSTSLYPLGEIPGGFNRTDPGRSGITYVVKTAIGEATFPEEIALRNYILFPDPRLDGRLDIECTQIVKASGETFLCFSKIVPEQAALVKRPQSKTSIASVVVSESAQQKRLFRTVII